MLPSDMVRELTLANLRRLSILACVEGWGAMTALEFVAATTSALAWPLTVLALLVGA